MTHVGDIIMEVSEKSIAKATRFSTEGEHWSKNMTITREKWQRFLKPQFQNVKLMTIMPRGYIKEEWQKVLMVLQKFITGEGCYEFTYQYHVRMLLHSKAKMMPNFPFFLMKSLQKMSHQVLKNKKISLTSWHHSSLIKILICYELEQWHTPAMSS